MANVPSSGFVKSSGSTLTSQSAISLTTDISGILPIANGGTGSSSIAAGFVTSNGSVLSSQSIPSSGYVTSNGTTLSGNSYPSSGLVTSNGSAFSSTAFPAAGAVTSNGSAFSSHYREVVKNVGVTNNSTITYANIPDMVSATLPVGKYKISAKILYQSAATTTGSGIRLINNTATLSDVKIQWIIPLTATTGNIISQTSVATNSVSTATPAALATYMLTGDGVIDVSVAGTVILQLRSEVAASNISVQTGSVLEIEAL